MKIFKVLFFVFLFISVRSEAQDSLYFGQCYTADYDEFMTITEDSIYYLYYYGPEWGMQEFYE